MNEKSLTHQDFCLVRHTAAATSSPEDGLIRRVGAYNDKLLLVEHRMEKGWVGARHRHVHDQIVYVVSGQLSVRVDATTFAAGAGDSFVVCGGVDHQASALEESVVLDVFTPCRYDYL